MKLQMEERIKKMAARNSARRGSCSGRSSYISKIVFVIFLIIIFSSIFFSGAIYAEAVPPLPNVFYGNFTINYTPAPLGTELRVRASSGFYCGEFTVQNAGYYGLLSCLGNDSETSQTEGPTVGEVVYFYVNDTRLLARHTNGTYSEAVPWISGNITRYDVRTKPVCGDGVCDPDFEVCSVCIFDCGICPGDEGNFTDGNFTTNLTPGPTTPGPTAPGTPQELQPLTPEICRENWNCTEWSPEICPPTETQTRTCEDLNNCGTFNNLPDTSRVCAYQPTCFDSILNGLESDVDCGGPECQKCTVGKSCRTNEDCVTLSCDPVYRVCLPATCDDGIQNQGEEGIDCGGPCPPCEIRRPQVEVPLPVELRQCGIFPWTFFITMMLISAMIIISRKTYFNAVVRKNRKFDQNFELLARTSFKYDRKTYWFSAAVVLSAILVSMYVYILCTFSGVPAILGSLLVASIVLYALKTYFEYDEKKAEIRFVALAKGHSLRTEKIFGLIEDELLSQIGEFGKEYSSKKEFRQLGELKSILESTNSIIKGFKETRDELEGYSSQAQKEEDIVQLITLNKTITQLSGKRNGYLKKISESLAPLKAKAENNEFPLEGLSEQDSAMVKDLLSTLTSYKEIIDSEIEHLHLGSPGSNNSGDAHSGSSPSKSTPSGSSNGPENASKPGSASDASKNKNAVPEKGDSGNNRNNENNRSNVNNGDNGNASAKKIAEQKPESKAAGQEK